ncbi:MAG: XisI protein [Chloroflexi bacterium]|nr:XisI protein [Chloroflexota bacterium]
MVSVTKDKVESLAEITRREVARYVGYSPVARLFPVLDDTHQTYAVIIIENDPALRPASAVVMARVVGDKVVIEEETTDKPLYEALMVNGGIPREQIVLAYAGESLPDETANQG